MKRSEAVTISELSKQVMKLFHIDESILAIDIYQDWAKIMGKFCAIYNGIGTLYQLDPNMIAQYTQSVSLKDKKLTVRLSSAPLRQELQMNSQMILSKIWEHYEITAEIIQTISFK